ncbi:hypothetical protein, partial [Streptomyces sp. A475]|uniref:hypothetical protein n=1 Tax=Streptomyces sp. A475 TaxID=3131976 RepID=UPI0030ECCDBB
MTPSVSPKNSSVRGESSPEARAHALIGDRRRQQPPVDFVEFGANAHGRHDGDDRHASANGLGPRARQGRGDGATGHHRPSRRTSTPP